MANFRQQGHSRNQVGGYHHWRSSSSYSRKPPLPQSNLHSTVPSWEKKFCYSAGIPWRKLIECKKYMDLHSNVLHWDDSAGKEAFDNAKKRFWAKINGLPCGISLPDPDIYIDDVDWNSSVDPELILDLERERIFSDDEKRGGAEVVIIGGNLLYNNQVLTPTGWGDDDAEAPKPVILGGSLLLNNQTLTPTGWGDDEAEAPKPSDPNSFAQGWDSNLHVNGVNSWEQGYAQNSQNDSQGWNQREQHYGGELQNKAKGRTAGNGNWNGNWGTTWDGGYNRKRENMSWSHSNTSAAYHYGNEYQNQMNRGRRNYRGGGEGGGRRGHYGYDRPYVEKVPTSKAW
ncbi:uncharacterized protein LOC130730130 [Lotus japonicus]|uniref:uncharacterized protein LOC130730130 n=1 Tax=Lotus japonicus TaxID=34305 RepID=UPI002582E9F7|nr:uncharacterized protein LOC130730130 [Lotus japonicus]